MDDNQGHNIAPNMAELKGIVGEIVGLEEQRAELAEQIRDKYREAKETGFDASVLRQIVGETLDSDKLDKHIEREIIVDTYRKRMGLIGDDADPHRAKLEAVAAALRRAGVDVNLGMGR